MVRRLVKPKPFHLLPHIGCHQAPPNIDLQGSSPASHWLRKAAFELALLNGWSHADIHTAMALWGRPP
eukprot:10121334-Prorocentrum_lima.AAC.1